MKKTVIVIFITLCGIAGFAQAKPTTAQHAEKVVKGWLKSDAKPLGMDLGTKIKKTEVFKDTAGQPAYYIVYVNTMGFVIVSADDLVEPIVGFVAGDSPYDPSPSNPLGALVSRDLAGRLAAAQKLQKKLDAGVQKKDLTKEEAAFVDTSVKSQGKWSKLQAYADSAPMTGLSSTISDVRVAPLIKTKWGQGYICNNLRCYNYYTPNNYLCGCVATAMAQLMRYHQFPTASIGVNPSTIHVNGVEETAYTRGGDGSGGPYNWSLMVTEPNCDFKVVGIYNGGDTHGFIYNGTTWMTLDIPIVGTRETLAFGISDNNIVGCYYEATDWYSSFLYNGVSWTVIHEPWSTHTWAYGIDGSNIVGTADSHSFLYNITTQAWSTIAVPGATYTDAYGIDGSSIVGSYPDGDHHSHGFLYNMTTQNWTTVDYPGARETEAFGIDGSNIVGWYDNHGFLFYNREIWITLDYPGADATDAMGIKGHNIVGQYWVGSRLHGFLYNATNGMWTNLDIPDSYDTSAYGITSNDAQRKAIGSLCYDAGLSVNMSYDSVQNGGSSANTLDAADAFVNTFYYSNARKGFNDGSNIPEANLNSMLNPNLDAKYPCLLGIYGSAGGHAVVADGYGFNFSTLYHHLNMGWNGSSDDMWYNLPNINSSRSFSSVEKCVYNIYTSGSGEIISGRVTYSSGAPFAGAPVTAIGSDGPYTAMTDSNGIYALVKVDSNSTYTVSVSAPGFCCSFIPASLSVTTATSTDNTTTSGNKWGNDFTATCSPSPSPPLAPAMISYPTSNIAGCYTVSWLSSDSAMSYQLERSNDSGSNWSQVYSGENLSYSENVGNGSYRYHIKATNCSGSSDWTPGTWDCVVFIIIGDFDGNGREDFADSAIFASAWMSEPNQLNWNSTCDISNPKDNVIDWKDFAVFAQHWLEGVGP